MNVIDYDKIHSVLIGSSMIGKGNDKRLPECVFNRVAKNIPSAR